MQRRRDAVCLPVALKSIGTRSMNPNYPLDCWYVAATSDEVGFGLFGRKLLDRPVVLYRLESGEVVALEDRCAHRGYPLSKGRLDGVLLVCGYHGLRYDTACVCVGVPSQPNVPYGVCVRAYPVHAVMAKVMRSWPCSRRSKRPRAMRGRQPVSTSPPTPACCKCVASWRGCSRRRPAGRRRRQAAGICGPLTFG